MDWQRISRSVFSLTVVAFCLFEFSLRRLNHCFHEFEAAITSIPWLLFVCMIVWCGIFLFLTLSWKDWPIIVLIFIAIVFSFIAQLSASAMDAIMLLAGITLGRGMQFILKDGKQKAESKYFLVGLIFFLAFSSWWHLDIPNNYYHGPRWMGLWYNPNLYGTLMGVGLVLVSGLIADECSGRAGQPDYGHQEPGIGNRGSGRGLLRYSLLFSLLISAGMIGTGLVFSYCRGAWLGTAIGLLYLAKIHRKFKWRFVLPGIITVAAVVCFFWHSTADTDQWYLKRLDLGRPSAQHRVAAWHGAIQIMLNHPLGVGWDNAVEMYDQCYSPPDDSALALYTNDYLLLGTQLGWLGLFCFTAYALLCLGVGKWKVEKIRISNSEFRIKMAYRAGVLVFLVTFWFDGVLFDFPTASVFWILLELGSFKVKPRCRAASDGQQVVPTGQNYERADCSI
jgi:hypothetical protein